MTKTKKKYDLENRTGKFGKDIIKLCRQVPLNPITMPIVTQLVKAATSVGANYCEADDAESPKDFKHKIGIVKKECRESKHHLRMLATAVPKIKSDIRPHWQEAKELNLIFNSIYRKIK